MQNPTDAYAGKYYTLGLLTIVYAFNFIDRQLIAILQEPIKADLSLSDGHLGLLTGFAFALFYVLAGLPIAQIADRGNRRNIISVSLFVWSFMTAISGMANNFFQLLLARIGVGVGEAGGTPPSHSIISDIFPENRRASALGFYSTGINIGILFGFLLGGWLNEFFDWRVAFAVVGAPGLLLAVIVRFTVKEPPRAPISTANQEKASIAEAAAVLWQSRSFRLLALGAALTAFSGYASINWLASYVIRNFGMGTGELGTWLALTYGVCGAIGVFFGSYIADKLAVSDKRWYARLPAIAGLVAVPFIVGQFMAPTAYTVLMFKVIPSLLASTYLGCVFAVAHSIVGSRMRASASALLLLIVNIVGLGLGPSAVGFLSDALAPQYGDDSLRLALLLVVPAATFLSAIAFFAASKHLREELENAPG